MNDGVAIPERASAPQRILALLRGPGGAATLALFAILEACVFPAPTEAALIALVLARREHAWQLVLVATAASLAGALAGYAMGDAMYGSVARPLLERFDLLRHADTVVDVYRDNAILALATSAWTPIPYMLYTMMAGASDMPLPTFVTGAMIGRTLKFLPLAALAYLFGPLVYRIVQRTGLWIVIVVTIAIAMALILTR